MHKNKPVIIKPAHITKDQYIKILQILVADYKWATEFWEAEHAKSEGFLEYERRVTRKLQNDLNTLMMDRRMGN